MRLKLFAAPIVALGLLMPTAAFAEDTVIIVPPDRPADSTTTTTTTEKTTDGVVRIAPPPRDCVTMHVKKEGVFTDKTTSTTECN